jgi:hypothetical protein
MNLHLSVTNYKLIFMTTNSTLLDFGFENLFTIQGTAGVWQNFFPHSAPIKKNKLSIVKDKAKLLNYLASDCKYETHANLHE